MRMQSHRRWITGLFSLSIGISLATSHALIFPIRDTNYDGSRNNISIEEINRRGDFQAEVGTGLLATPVGPYHFLTVGHVDTAGKVYYRGKAYGVVTQVVHQFMDIKIVKVDAKVSEYAQLQRTNIAVGDWVTVYGKSGVPAAPAIEKDGLVKGWKIHFKAPPGPNENWRPRWGRFQAEQIMEGRIGFSWDGRNPDCPTFAIGDSGGSAFINHKLVGLLDQPGSPVHFLKHPGGTVELGFIFDSEGLYNSFGQTGGTNLLTWNQILNVTGFANWIYDTITPPVRVHFAKPVPGWDEARASRIERSAVAFVLPDKKAAPEAIYQQAAISQGTGARIAYTATDRLSKEKYYVRLHFSPVYFKTPGKVLQNVVINRRKLISDLDPIQQTNQCKVVEIRDVLPDRSGRIEVSVEPGKGRNATLSGLEIILQEP